MDIFKSAIGRLGGRTVIHRCLSDTNDFMESDGSRVLILTPIKPVQGKKDEEKLTQYLYKNHGKIVHGKLAHSTNITDGHIAYIFLEEYDYQ